MQTSKNKILGQSRIFWCGVVLAIVLLAGAASWKRLLAEYQSYMIAKEFAYEYGPESTGTATLRHKDDLAVLFGGTIGLRRLKDLSNDPSLNSWGRNYAAEMHQYISEGKHLFYLEYANENYHGRDNSLGLPDWPYDEITIYIYERDRRILNKAKQVVGD